MTFDPSSVRRAYWSRLADEYDAMDKATVSLTTGELRTLLMDAELAERAAEERQVTADYHRQRATDLIADMQPLKDACARAMAMLRMERHTIDSLRAEIQRLESLQRLNGGT